MIEKVNPCPIPGFEEYIVHANGAIYSTKRERYLKQYDKKGYLYVYLYPNGGGGKRKAMFVHRAVALAFIPNPDSLPQVNHKDENPHNNQVENLEWCSAKYNCNYGNHKEKCQKYMRENNPFAGCKHSQDAKSKMRSSKLGKPSNRRKSIKVNGIEYESMTSAAMAYGISVSHLCGIRSGRKKNTYRLIFE